MAGVYIKASMRHLPEPLVKYQLCCCHQDLPPGHLFFLYGQLPEKKDGFANLLYLTWPRLSWSHQQWPSFHTRPCSFWGIWLWCQRWGPLITSSILFFFLEFRTQSFALLWVEDGCILCSWVLWPLTGLLRKLFFLSLNKLFKYLCSCLLSRI